MLFGPVGTTPVGSSASTAQALLSGSAITNASAAGSLSTAVRLAGAALVAASASGALTTVSGGLSGSASAAVSATGSLTTAVRLSGAATVGAQASGALTTSQSGMSGAASASTSSAGSLVTAVRLSGTAITWAAASGALTTAAVTMCADQNIWRGYVPLNRIYMTGGGMVSAFTLRGGIPTADMDPDDIEHYGVTFSDVLASLPGVTISSIDPIPQGVAVVAGETVTINAAGDATVLLSGTGLSDVDDNFCTFRARFSNKEQRDRTIYFRKVNK